MSNELGDLVASNASRVLGEVGFPVVPDIGQPAKDGRYLQGVDPYTGMPERLQRRYPHTYVTAAGALVLRRTDGRYGS